MLNFSVCCDHLHSSVKNNDANLINADVKADNGIIHVIDKVLMPNSSKSFFFFLFLHDFSERLYQS